jgi:hypothetical protein
MKIAKIIKNYIEDIFILSGLTIIVIATFLISKIIGLYVLGTVLFGLGIYFSISPPRKE